MNTPAYSKGDWHICELCAEKEYPDFGKAEKKRCWRGITVMDGICPLCKKQATLIPRDDFHVPSNSEDWD